MLNERFFADDKIVGLADIIQNFKPIIYGEMMDDLITWTIEKNEAFY